MSGDHIELHRCKARVRELEEELVATRVRLAGFDYLAAGRHAGTHGELHRIDEPHLKG